MPEVRGPKEISLTPENEYRRLFEDSRDAIYIGTTAGRILDINPAGVRLFCYGSKEEMLSLDIATDLYWNPEDRKAAHIAFMSQGFIEDLEIELRTKTGQRLRVRETASAILGSSGEILGFRGILRDITEQRRLEEQLRQSQKMEAIGRLAEGVAHDFNNLLTAINGYSELILVQIDEDSPLRTGVSEIRRAGKRAAELTRRLLTLSRHQAFSPRRLDLNRIVTEMERLLRRVLGENVILRTTVDPDLHPVFADQGQIEQIILNLAINARDSLDHGGQLNLTTTNATRSSNPDMRFVQLTVSDTGKGMPEEARSHIFEPFFTTKDQGHNTGLGLAIVYSIVQQYGGHIEVESNAGAGTSFNLFFPQADPLATDSEPTTFRQSPSIPRGTETILLVEDDDSVRELVGRILKLQGYRVLAAQNARTALELSGELNDGLDLLLTDVVMPDTCGPALAEKLGKRFRNLRVLFMSGYADSNDGVRLLSQQRAAFLQKPFSPEVLAHKVRELLDDEVRQPSL